MSDSHTSVQGHWEYTSVYVKLRKQRWQAEFSDAPTLVGWNQILNHLGSLGWELVSVLAEDFVLSTSPTPNGVRLFFKRPGRG